MATPNRSSLLTKAHRVLKKYYKPVVPPDRPLLESLLFAACLEDERYEPAEQAYAAVSTSFFDWNEVRVSSVKELAEVMPMLNRAEAAAQRVKRSLFSVFEATYSFEIEAMKKQNLGQAIQKLQKFKGVSPFMVSYAVQRCLGGHAVPVDSGALEALYVIGAISEQEKEKHQAPGIERAIAKNKGVEFGSLLHQLSAELVASPFSPNVHKILLEINAEGKARLPKRHKPAPPKPSEPPPKKAVAPPPAPVAGKKGVPLKKELPPAKKDIPAKKVVAKKEAARKESPPAKRPAAKPSAPERKKAAAAAAVRKRKPR